MAMIQGEAYWAKITGRPQPGFTKSQLEWSFDLAVDEAASKKLTELGVAEYIKPVKHPKTGKEHASGKPYIKFTRREIKADGSPSQPIRIVDRRGEPWPEGKQIGNGSKLNVKFAVNEKQSGGLKPSVIAVQVWELVEYEGGDSFPVDATGEESW